MTINSTSAPARGSLRAQFRDTARYAILEAAESTFSELGLNRGRMEVIARRAGVSVGTLYNHFEDREALVAALIVRRREEMIGRLDTALAHAESGFESRLSAFLEAVFSHFELHRRFLAIAAQGEPTRFHMGLTSHLTHPSPTFQALVARAEKIMAQGVREKRLAAERPALLATLLVGMVRAVLVGELLTHPRRRTSEFPKRIQRLFLEGAGRP